MLSVRPFAIEWRLSGRRNYRCGSPVASGMKGKLPFAAADTPASHNRPSSAVGWLPGHCPQRPRSGHWAIGLECRPITRDRPVRRVIAVPRQHRSVDGGPLATYVVVIGSHRADGAPPGRSASAHSGRGVGVFIPPRNTATVQQLRMRQSGDLVGQRIAERHPRRSSHAWGQPLPGADRGGGRRAGTRSAGPILMRSQPSGETASSARLRVSVSGRISTSRADLP